MRRLLVATGADRSIRHNPFALRTLSRLLNALACPAQLADGDLLKQLVRRAYAATHMPSVAPEWPCSCGRLHRPYERCDLGVSLNRPIETSVLRCAAILLEILARDVVKPDVIILMNDASAGAPLALMWFGSIKHRTATRRLKRLLLPGTTLPLLARLPTDREWNRVAGQVQALFQFERACDRDALCSFGLPYSPVGLLWRELPCRGRRVGEVIADLWENGGGLSRPTDEELSVWLKDPIPAIRNAAFIALGHPLDVAIWPTRGRRRPVRSSDGRPVDV